MCIPCIVGACAGALGAFWCSEKQRAKRQEAREAREFERGRKQGGARSEEKTPVAEPSTRVITVADELQKLADMKAKGLLNDEEFAAAKQKLLEEQK